MTESNHEPTRDMARTLAPARERGNAAQTSHPEWLARCCATPVGEGQRSTLRRLAVLAAVSSAFAPNAARGGPPYITDDPEPVEHRHYELYLASRQLRTDRGWEGSAPHFEANYGVVPEVQLHIVLPLAYVAPHDAPAAFGYGDTELGGKVRFLRETKHTPMLGTFPLLFLPTGNSDRALGSGGTVVFLPLWLQKSFSRWTTYGGGGRWIDFGTPRTGWWYFGWQVQRRVDRHVSVGAELFHFTAHGDDPSETGFNVGGVFDIGGPAHLLVSAGRSIKGPSDFIAYGALLISSGPHERPLRAALVPPP